VIERLILAAPGENIGQRMTRVNPPKRLRVPS